MNQLAPREVAQAAIPCTCGELFQGALDGQPCLVSCPIDVFSVARIDANAPVFRSSGQRKVRLAQQAISQRTGRPPVAVEVHTPLPVGRGYGTSTADIGAALFATSRAYGDELSPVEASRMAVAIEPTDSTLFPGLALFDHRAGSFYESLGAAPPAQLLILDPGGTVDSEAFNALDWGEALARVAGEQRRAFQTLRQGLAAGDLWAIGEAATLSAKCHQSFCFSPLVEQVIGLSQKLGAAGICRAHSGVIVGMIFPMDDDLSGAFRYLAGHFSGKISLRKARLTGGGLVTPSTQGVQESKI